MNFEKTVNSLPEEIISRFRLAISSGHWQDGMKLTQRQRRICEAALALREQRYPLQ